MGQQQLLLIILGVIIVGISIAVGLSLFAANSVQANKDAMINDLNNLAANAYQYKIRPASMAGGGNSYVGYVIPYKMSSNENATYLASGASATTIHFAGSSVMAVANTAAMDLDADGRVIATSWAFGGEFQ